MQVLKDEIKEKIDESAKALFIELGYEKTTMIKIAKNANISKSNLYNYYVSKQAIFEHVTLQIRNRIDTISKQISSHAFDMAPNAETFITSMTQKLITHLMNPADDFVLIMNKAKGSGYEWVKHQLVDDMSEHFITDFQGKVLPHQKQAVKIITSNLFEALTQIATFAVDTDTQTALVHIYMTYHINGFQSILAT